MTSLELSLATPSSERLRRLARLGLVLLALLAPAAHAQRWLQPVTTPIQAGLPPALREIGWEQRLGERVPLDVALRDESGRAVKLGDYFGRRPVVLSLVYYECPMLCTLTLNGLTSALSVLRFDVGREFEVVTVSFEPKETPALAAAKKDAYLKRYKRPGAEAGWHFLTGDAEAIQRLTQSTGFRYQWDEATRQYAHPSGIVVLTPDGRLARYLYGIEYAPKDLRFALVEASEGRIGTPIDSLALYCYQYDPATGSYGAAVMRVLRAGAVLTMLSLCAFWAVMWRRERGRHAAVSASAAAPPPVDVVSRGGSPPPKSEARIDFGPGEDVVSRGAGGGSPPPKSEARTDFGPGEDVVSRGAGGGSLPPKSEARIDFGPRG